MQDQQDSDFLSGDEVRQASFPQARRGYDREAVDSFLDRVADWLDRLSGTQPAAPGSAPDVKRELKRVGERTAGILTAAEEAAAQLRREAEEYARTTREAADEDARSARLAASRKAHELVGRAEAKSERIIDEAIARRRRLNQAVASMVERRDEIAEETARLAEELIGAVEILRERGSLEADDEAPPVAPDEPASAAAGDDAAAAKGPGSEPDAEQEASEEPPTPAGDAGAEPAGAPEEQAVEADAEGAAGETTRPFDVVGDEEDSEPQQPRDERGPAVQRLGWRPGRR